MSPLEHRVERDPAAVAAFRSEWEERCAADHQSLYASYEWCASLWEAHFDGRGVDFHVFRDRSGLRAIVPITRSRIEKFHVPLVMRGLLTNSYGRNHNDLILFGDRTESYRAFLERLGSEPWDLLLLGSIANPATLQMARDWERAGSYRVVPERYVDSPYLTLTGTWSEYLAAQSGNFRSDLKRKQKRAAAAGFRIRSLTSPTDVGEALDAMYSIETRSWKEGSGTSITTQSHARRFYDVFLPKAAERGWLLCYLLELGGTPAAFDMGILHGGKYYMLKTSYDQEWKDVSPGFLLRAHVIEQLYAMGAREHDFLGDPEPWKLRWTSEIRSHWNLYLYNTRRLVPNLYSAALKRFRS